MRVWRDVVFTTEVADGGDHYVVASGEAALGLANHPHSQGRLRMIAGALPSDLESSDLGVRPMRKNIHGSKPQLPEGPGLSHHVHTKLMASAALTLADPPRKNIKGTRFILESL